MFPRLMSKEGSPPVISERTVWSWYKCKEIPCYGPPCERCKACFHHCQCPAGTFHEKVLRVGK